MYTSLSWWVLKTQGNGDLGIMDISGLDKKWSSGDVERGERRTKEEEKEEDANNDTVA